MGAKPPATPHGPVVFDSDVLIDHLRGFEKARRFFEQVPFSQRALPAVVFMEVLCGARDRNELRRIQRWVDGEFSSLLHVSEEISRRAVALVQRYTLSSRMDLGDALIAGTALTMNASLATGNVRHFRLIKGLKILPFR